MYDVGLARDGGDSNVGLSLTKGTVNLNLMMSHIFLKQH